MLCMVAVAVGLLSGCSGLPDHLKTQANGLPPQILAAAQAIERQEKGLEALRKSADYKTFLHLYDKEENWDNSLKEAKAKLSEAQAAHAQQVKSLLDKNDPSDELKLSAQIQFVRTLLKEAANTASIPLKRVEFIRAAKQNAPNIVAQARVDQEKLTNQYTELKNVTERYQRTYPAKEKDIATRFAPFKLGYEQGEKALKVAETEFAAKTPHYARLGDSGNNVMQVLAKFTKDAPAYRSKLGELDREYSKALVDMQVRYYLTVGRTSWDDYYDWPTENEYTYPMVELKRADYDAFAALGEGAIIAKQNVVDLGFDPKSSWPSGDNSAEYEIDGLDERYFHRYLIVEDGQKRTTDWEEVNEAFFDEYSNDLGMDIIAKARGEFEEDKNDEPAPAGLAYVGNKQYGEWRKDPSTGQSFWHWYGQYRFFSDLIGGPRPYYSYNEWNDWNRNYRGERAYYGLSKKTNGEDEARYGSHSPYIASRFGASNWVRSGEHRYQRASVRNVGAELRGGGPGGGGK